MDRGAFIDFPDILVVGGGHGDGFGGVHRAAAAQADHHIAAFLAGQPSAAVHHSVGGVGSGLGKYHRADPVLSEQVDGLLHVGYQ
ncbi:MAG TPA: hypothetical protein PJ988_21395 [Anaerolinea sp.]|nr:hypothetical protein [Anaerolinea sp.]